MVQHSRRAHRLQSDNCLLSFQDSNSPIQNGWQKYEDGRQLNVARDDDLYTCMFLCGQTHIMYSEKMLKRLLHIWLLFD